MLTALPLHPLYQESCSHASATDVLLIHCWSDGWREWWMDGWMDGWVERPERSYLPRAGGLLLAASTVIWITAFTAWNVLTGFRFSNSFLKLPSLAPSPIASQYPSSSSLPLSFSLSSLFSSPLCCAVSLPADDQRIGSCIIPPCWVIGICLLLFLFCIEALPAAVHACPCVCMLFG